MKTIHTSYHQRIISNNTYKLLSENSLKTFVTTTSEIIANSTYKLLSENHSKQYLQIITTEIIANYAYKRLSENSTHSKQYFLYIAHNTDNSFKTIIR